MAAVRIWIISFIFVANASVLFLHLNSDPYLEVPADKLRIEQREIPGGADITVSVNAAWVRGWYSESVAAFTVAMALILLLSLPKTTRTVPPHSSMKVPGAAR